MANDDLSDILSSLYWATFWMCLSLGCDIVLFVCQFKLDKLHKKELEELKAAEAVRDAEREEKYRQRERESDQEYRQKHRDLESTYLKKEEGLRQEMQQSLTKALAELRLTAEERFRPAIDAQGLEDLDQKLREAQLMHSHSGRVLSVRVLAVPTGWTSIEWMLDPDVPNPLRIICFRDDKIQFVDHAYKGRFTTVLARGKEYRFKFQAMDGSRDREDSFQFTVKLPTPGQWRRKVGEVAPDTTNERERQISDKVKRLTNEHNAWEKGRREGHQAIDGSDAPEGDKRRGKARLDAQIQRERDKDEPQ